MGEKKNPKHKYLKPQWCKKPELAALVGLLNSGEQTSQLEVLLRGLNFFFFLLEGAPGIARKTKVKVQEQNADIENLHYIQRIRFYAINNIQIVHAWVTKLVLKHKKQIMLSSRDYYYRICFSEA